MPYIAMPYTRARTVSTENTDVLIIAHREHRDENNCETRKVRSMETGGEELETQELSVGRPLLWAPPFRRAEHCPPYLLVRDRRAGWAGEMDDFEALEADFATPFFEIGGRIIERIAEFDQHV